MMPRLSETTLFYNYLLDISVARIPAVAHPTTKSNSGLVGNWADQVAIAGRSTPSFATVHSPEVGFTPLGPPGPLASRSRANRTSHVYRPDDNKENSLAPETPDLQVSTCCSRWCLTDIITATDSPQTCRR